MDMMCLEKELREAFCWFHENPELAYEEVRTTEKIREILTAHGIEIIPYKLETGLVAIIRGEKKGAVQALRCDIDALPIVEETGLSYCSKEAGKMHACGHDMHITAGIGCAILLQENRSRLRGTVKIIFQPAEETSLGALKILETDVMNGVDKIWGFHADPTNEAGTIAIREGYVTAAVDRFVITVKGVGCHGAHPDHGIDPIPVAAAIIQALQSIVSRNVNAFHPSLLSVTRVSAGTTWNVIPAEAVMEGTVRTMEREDRVLYEKRLREIAERTAQAYGAEAEVEWIAGPPATCNDKAMADFCARQAETMGLPVAVEESSLGGDDFAFYEEKIPGCYVKLGTGIGHPIHHPAFKVEPEMLLSAAEFLSGLILEFQLKNQRKYDYVEKQRRKAMSDEIKYPENQKIIDCMQKEVDGAVGKGTWDKIASECCPSSSMDNRELSAATYSMLKNLDALEREKGKTAFVKVRHGLTRENFRWARETFLKYKDIDKFAEAILQEQLENLKRLKDNNELFYGQIITEQVYQFALTVPDLFYGKRYGNKILSTAIPFNAHEYLNAENDREKRYFMCHCQFARESILMENTVSDTMCSCSLGHNLMFWETVLDTELEGEVLYSALHGDERCQFAIFLPDEILHKYTVNE